MLKSRCSRICMTRSLGNCECSERQSANRRTRDMSSPCSDINFTKIILIIFCHRNSRICLSLEFVICTATAQWTSQTSRLTRPFGDEKNRSRPIGRSMRQIRIAFKSFPGQNRVNQTMLYRIESIPQSIQFKR